MKKRTVWIAAVLPDKELWMLDQATSIGGGWRRLSNYYAMRDILWMYYMD